MLQLFKVFMHESVPCDVSRVLSCGLVTQGPKVEEFEGALRDWFQHPYILTLNSATSGLTLALRMLNLKEHDEVLASPLTCTATNWPILANGLLIKWVDVDPHTCNMNLDDLKSKITYKTKAVLFVHWGGSPVDLDKVDEIKSYTKATFGHDLHVIEDCAHAFGAEYNGAKIGTHGNICVFSLQAIKHLTTGDGGLLFLPNPTMYERAKLLRWYGISREQRSGGGDFRLESDVVEWGYKFHMNDINATIGLSNLPHIEANLEQVRRNVSYYKDALADVDGVTLLHESPNSVSSYWIYTIKVNRKSEFIQFMKSKSVIVSQVHNRNDLHSCVAQFKCHLPILDQLEKDIICIPCGWWITENDREHVVRCIKEFCRQPLID
jgi:dTDP-4-amino-4,6-dideoxygalactose transaminase